MYSDERLLQLLKNGDRKAFESIYKKYWPRLFDAAFKRVRSKEIAEEIIQDLFTSIWFKRKELHLTHSFATYISTALKYSVFNYIRSEITKKKYLDSVKQVQPRLNYAVEESILYNELNNAIENEIDGLPEKCRLVFNLSRKENMTFKEIAVKLNISINTVEKHVGKALKVLRTNLKDHIASAYPFLFFLLLF